MEYLPPYVIHGSHTIKSKEINRQAENYKKLLMDLRDEKIDIAKTHLVEYLNDLSD